MHPWHSSVRTALSATSRNAPSGQCARPVRPRAHRKRSAAARTSFASSVRAGARVLHRSLPRGGGGGLLEEGDQRALEAARPRPVAAVASAKRSRKVATPRTPACQPSRKCCSDPCGALLSQIQVWAPPPQPPASTRCRRPARVRFRGGQGLEHGEPRLGGLVLVVADAGRLPAVRVVLLGAHAVPPLSARVWWATHSGSRTGFGAGVWVAGVRMMRQLVCGAVTTWTRCRRRPAARRRRPGSGRGGLLRLRSERGATAFLHRAQLLPVDRVDARRGVERDVDPGKP